MPKYDLMRRTTRALTAMLASSVGFTWVAAQTASAPDSAADLAKYDKNHNGVLDTDERAARDRDAADAASAERVTNAGDSVVKLSPFQVSADDDRGYYATNTLSGTRLNSKLEDLGSSITVVTKQQMEDFALLDVNDIFLYEAGTEGTGNYTDFSIDRNGAVIDNVQGNPNNANRIRGIASANQSRGNYATSGRVPLDPIDMDAVEISRGPNSSIFGLGNASGTVNIIPATANLSRAFTRVEGRIDDRGSTRASIDLSRPIIKDKLAVRANAVFQQDKFDRKPSVARSKRYNGMFTWRPFSETTLRGSIQYYEDFARRPNSILPRDGITYWEQSGRPIWDAAASTVTRNGVTTVVPYNGNQGRETTALGPGLESGGTGLYARPSLFINPDGSVGLWEVGRQSSTDPTTGAPTPDRQAGNARLVESAPPPRLGPLWQTAVSLDDKARYDWTSVNLAAPNWSQTRNRTFTLELEQFFLRTPRNLLGVQVGWNREESEKYSRNFIGQGGGSPMIVYIDVNKTLPDGRANPYFLRPYMNATEPTASRNPWFRDTFRGQLAYQLTLSREPNWLKWLGDHSFSAYGEYKNTISASFGYRDAITDNHAWIPAGSARAAGVTAARGYYRYYIGDANGDNIDYSPPDWRSAQGTYNFNWYDVSKGAWVAEPATIGEAYSPGRTRTRNIIKTEGAVTQNHFFKDRLVTTFGIRKDSNFNRDAAGTAVGSDGIQIDLAPTRTWPNDWLRRDGRTKTAGFVVKPLRNWKWLDRASRRGGLAGFIADAAQSLDFFYNKSDSFVPSTVAQNLVGELLPDPTGTGKDYGIELSLFRDRLIIRYDQYENVQKNSRFGDSGVIASRAARIDFSRTTGGSDRFNLYRNELGWVRAAHSDWTDAQVETEVAKQMGFPEDQLAKMNAFPISDTSDVTAKGKEIEVNFNPNRYFRSKLNVTEQQSIDNHLSPAIIRYINERLPIWQKIIDPTNGEPWFTTRYGSSGTPEEFLNGVVLAPYKLATANEGKTKSQIRQWRVNALGTVQLAAFTENRYLQRMSVSGAVRWEDKASIGYYTYADDPNAYDPNRPIFDKGHTYVDAGISYAQKIFGDRIQMRVQLNVRNLTESGRLQPIGALPNGLPHSYRIIDPRQFILTTTFDF
jgi:hypothetical protein